MAVPDEQVAGRRCGVGGGAIVDCEVEREDTVAELAVHVHRVAIGVVTAGGVYGAVPVPLVAVAADGRHLAVGGVVHREVEEEDAVAAHGVGDGEVLDAVGRGSVGGAIPGDAVADLLVDYHGVVVVDGEIERIILRAAVGVGMGVVVCAGGGDNGLLPGVAVAGRHSGGGVNGVVDGEV